MSGHRLFRRLRPISGEPRAPAHLETDPDSSELLTRLNAELTGNLKNALERIHTARDPEAGVLSDIQRVSKHLQEYGLGAPDQPEIGAVSVRVVGIPDGEANSPVPLAGLRVRTVTEECEVVETATTDLTGYALLPSEYFEGDTYNLEIVDPSGKPVATLSGRIPENDSIAERVELAESQALRPAFERGQKWAQAVAEARDKLDNLKSNIAAALEYHRSRVSERLGERGER